MNEKQTSCLIAFKHDFKICYKIYSARFTYLKDHESIFFSQELVSEDYFCPPENKIRKKIDFIYKIYIFLMMKQFLRHSTLFNRKNGTIVDKV